MTAEATAAATRDDAFLGGRVTIRQPVRGFRSGSDAVMLAAAVPARPGDRVLELGCGAGAALFCLGARVSGLMLSGLELQPGYAALARLNAATNGLQARIVEGSVTAMPATLKAEQFDRVLMNPPFHRPAEGTGANDDGRDTAHREGDGSLADWIGAGLARVGPKGSLTVIHRAARLGEVLALVEGRLGAVAILPLAARPGVAADRVIVSGSKGRRAATRLLAPLVMHGETGNAFTTHAEAVLRGNDSLQIQPGGD